MHQRCLFQCCLSPVTGAGSNTQRAQGTLSQPAGQPAGQSAGIGLTRSSRSRGAGSVSLGLCVSVLMVAQEDPPDYSVYSVYSVVEETGARCFVRGFRGFVCDFPQSPCALLPLRGVPEFGGRMNIRTSVVLPALIMRRDSPHATCTSTLADEQTGGLEIAYVFGDN